MKVVLEVTGGGEGEWPAGGEGEGGGGVASLSSIACNDRTFAFAFGDCSGVDAFEAWCPTSMGVCHVCLC